MNRAELIDAIGERLEQNRRGAADTLDAVLDAIKDAVVKGEKVQIPGFGIFENIARSARTARNPATGETIKLKATKVPKFRAGAEFKALVAGARKAVKSTTASAKKAPAKKAPVKKAAPVKKVAPAKKAPAKKAAPVKKVAPAKKAPAKKTTAKKAPAKKTTAKKTTTAKK